MMKMTKPLLCIVLLFTASINVIAQEPENETGPAKINTDLPVEGPSNINPEEGAVDALLNETGPLVTLNDAHKLAIKNNPTYKNVNEQIIQSQTMIQSAWSMLLPNLSADANVIRNKNEVNIAFPQFDPTNGAIIGMSDITIQEKWQKHLGFTANITLFNARSIPLIKLAYNMVDQTELEALIARNNLLFAVTSAYYQTANLKTMVGVYMENLSIANEFLRMAKGRKAAGQSTKIDVMRADIRKLEAQQQLDDTIDAFTTAKNSLGFILGIKGQYKISDPEDMTQLDQGVDELTKLALKNRAEIKSSELNIEIAEHSKKETLSKWIPKFDATWKLDMNSAGGFSGDKTNWMLIFGANWSILEGGGRIAELKQRKSKIRVAANQLEQTVLDIKKDVDKHYRDIISKKRNVEVTEQMVALAEENHKMISAQYNVGMATSLDLMDAATELARKKILLAIARLYCHLAILTLQNTIGEYNSLSFEKK